MTTINTMNEEKNFYDNNYDVCDFAFEFDCELSNTDEQDNEKNKEESKKVEDLENEFITWKLENWKLFLINNWHGDFELYYQFMKQREQRQEIS